MIDRRGFAFRAHMSATGYQLLGAPLYIGPGRPLGFHLQGEDELYVCDSLKGLLRVQLSSGAIEVLANAVKASDGGEPQPINYANVLDIGSDGSVYFTSCTDGPVARNTLGFYDTVETNLARVHRHWLRGPRSGEMQVLLAGLPGFPDGISRSPDGGFWVGLVAPLSPWGAIVTLNAEGEPSHALYDLDGNRVSSISAVNEHEGRIFLGNLGGDYVSCIDLMADEKFR